MSFRRSSVVLTLLISASPVFCSADSEFVQAPSMHTPRAHHAATLLKNGQVLVTGGDIDSESQTNTAELYNPVTNSWRYTKGSMNAVRSMHTATLLSSGKVLIAGGENLDSGALTSAEIYDPATGIFSLTASMSQPRYGFQSVALRSGKVLAMGGRSFDNSATSSVELYSPSTGAWATAAPYPLAVIGNQVLLLPNGEALSLGGYDGSSPQTYGDVYAYNSPANNWLPMTPMSIPRVNSTAILLASGSVLIVGGAQSTADEYASTEIYNPAGAGSTQPGPFLNTARAGAQAVRLTDGRVLVTGGDNECYGCPTNYLNSAELLDAGLIGPWVEVGPMSDGRESHTATILNSGQALLAGGVGAAAGNLPMAGSDLWCGNSSATSTITVTTNTGGASFTLFGPAIFTGSGTAASFNNVPGGTYTITFNPASGYVRPAPQTQTVVGGIIKFNGVYKP